MMTTTTNNPPQTILTVSEFENLTSNYYLSNSSGNSYYSAVTLQRLPWVIYNVEINLNAMLNGRLYKRYPPDALQFNGVNGLTPQVEQETLMQCLTECVEYKLLTQQYVNLNNNYSGNISGQNNYNTRNSNAIGLRQDIQAKLSVLGLYANIIVGEKKPEGVIKSYSNGGYLTIQQLQEIGNYLQNASLTFNKSITFNGGINTMANINADTINSASANVTSLNATNANITNLTANGNINLNGAELSTVYHGITYRFPQSMLDLTSPFSSNLSDWSFFGAPVSSNLTFPQNYNQGRLMGEWYVPAGKLYLQYDNTTTTKEYKVYKYHNQILNAIPSSYFTKATWYSINSNGVITINVAQMVGDAYNGNTSYFWMQLNTANTPDLDVTEWTNYQIILDKVEVRMNFLGGIDSNGNATRQTGTYYPYPYGATFAFGIAGSNGNCGVTVNTTANTITLSGAISQMSALPSASMSPWWNAGNNQSLQQINLAMDIDFTIVLCNLGN